MTKFNDFKIIQNENEKKAIREDMVVTIPEVSGIVSKIVHRREVNMGTNENKSCLVARLDDVYVYIKENNEIVISKEPHLRP